MTTAGRFGLPILLLISSFSALPAAELEPFRVDSPLGPGGPQVGRFAERTLRLGIEIDRHEARLVAFTLKPRPFQRELGLAEPRPYRQGRRNQLEVVLLDGAGGRHTRRLEVGPLCLSHDPGTDSHVFGDTILLHRDSLIVDLPALPGFDRVEVAYYEKNRGLAERRSLGTVSLDRSSFTPAGGSSTFDDLDFGDAADAPTPPPSPEAATALWPEDFADPDIYTVFGDEAEGDSRVNVVIVPDGYTYASKALMEQHAASMISHFRGKTPYAEHDRLINYTLVYAYSATDGTDQCDCGIVTDTAMGTRFPATGAPCLNSANRCLFYGGGCDTSGTANIVDAELRAPFQDVTIVMVNTTRYGGCGGSRAVYSAGNASATEVAVHELGHSLAGLADEYQGNTGCGSFAGEINTSTNSVRGAWFEWIADLGPPVEGGQYFDNCIYRPEPNCEMRALDVPFCSVCNQHWSLVFFGHPRVAPSAPIASMSPAAAAVAFEAVPTDFEVGTRLADGVGVTNQITWTIDGPGYAEPTVVASGMTTYSHTFDQTGVYTLSCEVIADTNFVKPQRYGANVDTAVWSVDVQQLPPAPEVSPPGAVAPLAFDDRQTVSWEDAASSGVTSYNLYRGQCAGLAGGSYGSCEQPDLVSAGTSVVAAPSAGDCWTYLVAGKNALGEGPLGETSAGAARPNGSPCP